MDKGKSYFVYDLEAQERLSNYKKMLIETGFVDGEDWDYQPEAFCLISAGNSACYPPRWSFDVETDDADALIQFIGALELVKSQALERLQEIESNGHD